MNASQTLPRHETASKAETTAARPVTEMLLELAYLLHATKVVGVRQESKSRATASTRRLV